MEVIMTGTREYLEKNLSVIHGARRNYPTGSSGVTNSFDWER